MAKADDAMEGGGKDPQADTRKSIQSVENGMHVIESLLQLPAGRERLGKIAEASGMSRSQAHRYLLAFVKSGLVVQHAESGIYSLGPMALRLGLAAISRLDAVASTTTTLQALVDETGFTGIISVWGDFGPTIVRWINGTRPVLASMSVGSILPLRTSTAGRIFVAFHHPALFQDLLAREGVQPGSEEAAALARAVEDVRRDGYAATDGKVITGLAAISAPVFDFQGASVATLGLLGYSGDATFMTEALCARVRQAGQDASERLGWNGGTPAAPPGAPAVTEPLPKSPRRRRALSRAS